jgi:hypothetical protein
MEKNFRFFKANSYNIIQPYIVDGLKLINNIVCAGSNNYFSNDCYDNTIIGNNNSFGMNCNSNLLIATSQSQFGERVHHCTFMQCGSTVFGRYDNQNIGLALTDSINGESCNNNNFGNGCSGLKLDRGCSNNTFGNYCYFLTIGASVTTS